MSSGEVHLILRAIGELRREVRGEIAEHMTTVREKLDAIEHEARRTNGRLAALELWRARIAGAKWAIGRAPTLLACAGSVVAIAVALTS